MLKLPDKKTFYNFYCLLILLLWSANSFGYEIPSASGIITGIVYDDNRKPLQGAGVILGEVNVGTVTGQDGRFIFRNLRDGFYTIHVKYMGFASERSVAEVRDGHAEIEFILKPTHIELREVIVLESATGFVDTEKSLSVTIANRDFFSSSSSMTLVQSLQRIPGITSMDIGTGVSKPVIRGFGFNRLIVAQNNIKQQGQQWGADHGLEIDSWDVDRVEILKGPGSLVYGSDAIGGAINIRPPVVLQENSVQGEFAAAAHSNNDLISGTLMTAVSKDGRFFRLRYSYQDYGNYRVPADEFVYNRWVIGIPGQRLKNTSGESRAFSSGAGIIRPWGMSSITLSNFSQISGFFPASHGIPNPDALQQPGNPRNPDFPRQRVDHLRLVSNTTRLFYNHRLEFDLGYQQNHRQELNPPHQDGRGPLPDHNTELELILNTFSGNIKLHSKLSENRSLLVGISGNIQQNRRGGYNFLLPDFTSGETGVYGIINQRLNQQLFLNAGIRIDAAATDITSFVEPVWQDTQTIIGYRERVADITRSFFNSAFSSGLSWIASESFNLKINAGSSFRNPTPVELSANGIHHGSFRHEMGDAHLDPERAYQFDLGITFQQKEFYLHVSPFVNYFSNYLFLNPSGIFSTLPGGGQIYRFQQAKALHLGGEIYIDGHITHNLHTSLGADLVWAQNLDNNYAIPFTPPPALLGELSYSIEPDAVFLRRLRLISSIRAVAAQNRVARNEPATDAYTLINMGINPRFSINGHPVEVLFMVNNVFDHLYKNHLSFYRILELPEPGRNFTIRITTGFHLSK
jgi:iron complex outermembrane recepter protein